MALLRHPACLVFGLSFLGFFPPAQAGTCKVLRTHTPDQGTALYRSFYTRNDGFVVGSPIFSTITAAEDWCKQQGLMDRSGGGTTTSSGDIPTSPVIDID